MSLCRTFARSLLVLSVVPLGGLAAQGAPVLAPRPEPAAVAAPSWRTMAARDSLRPFGTLREQAVIRQQWLERRMETILPALMRKYGVDMWVVPMREYNEDPAFRSLVSPTTFAARRRTIYVFFDRGAEGIERIAFGGTNQGGVYKAIRSMKAVAAPAAGSRANDRRPSSGATISGRCSRPPSKSGSRRRSRSTTRAPGTLPTASRTASISA
jgi:hypothetical protein